MAGIFKANDIVRAAVEAEKKGKEFYECLAGRVGDEKIKALFTDLAQEELKHKDIFQALLDRLEPVEVPAYSDQEEYDQYFDALINSHMLFSCGWGEVMLDQVRTEQEALKLAMNFERDSLLFFKEMKEFVPAGERKIIDQCIDEERKHLVRLKQMMPV
jgi:rubrerythrin